MVESLALLHGLMLCKERKFSNILVEVDSVVLVHL